MICKKCGKEILLDYRYCPFCGDKLQLEKHDFSYIYEGFENLFNGIDPFTGEIFDSDEIYKDEKLLTYANILLNHKKDNNLKLYEDGNENIQKRNSINVLSRPSDEIFNTLKTWRKKKSIELTNIPEYLILPNETLMNIAKGDICTIEDIKEIKGIGKRKFVKYANDIFDILKPYIYEVDKETYDNIMSSKRIQEKDDKDIQNKRQNLMPANAGLKWTAEDDKKLREEFINGRGLHELADMFQRTTISIQARLLKLGLFSSGTEVVDYFRNRGE